MKIGNSVKVKKGIISPDYDDLIIGGWQGRIKQIDGNIITFELDSVTLCKLGKDYIADSIEEDAEWNFLSLEIDEVLKVEPRDTEDDVLRKYNEINRRYSVDEEEKRISSILGSDNNYVNDINLKKYLDYLIKNIKLPCVLTGMEDFDWEEPYVIGGWDKEEYEKKKITNPSYTDKFEFIEIINEIVDWKGIYAKVKRQSDEKEFVLPFWDLEVVNNESQNFILISDYSSWMTNYRQ